MLNWLWLTLVLAGVLVAAWRGDPGQATAAAVRSAQGAVEFVLGLLAVMALWMGLNRIAERAGLMEALARALRPLVLPLFPDVPRDHPAVPAILMNVSANLLGLGNAATPFGLKAMSELQRLNPQPERATAAMCTLLALNTSSVTLIPATVIALRAASGAAAPADIIAPTLVATICGAAAALAVDRWCRRRHRRAP